MALHYDLRINQGETLQLAIPVLDDNGDPVALSGMTARGQIRSYAAAPTVLYEWSAAAQNLALDANNVVLRVSAATSSAWEWRTASYDVELVDTDGNTTRLVEGHVVIYAEVTR